MRTIYKFLLLLSLTTLFNSAFAQESCYDCDYDSLRNQLPLVKTDTEKAKLLMLLIDLSPLTDTTLEFIDQLVRIDGKIKGLDTEPYKLIRQALISLKKKDDSAALDYYKKAIVLFDKKKKIITSLLYSIRVIYNQLNQREERFKFYTDKLNYYRLNGPVENTAPCYHALGGSYTLKADYNQSISNYLRAAEIYQKFSKRSYYNSMSVVAVRYGAWGNIERSLYYSEVCKQIAAGLDTTLSGYHNLSLSKIMLTQNKFAEALDYAQKINLAIPNETNIYYAIGLAQKSLIYTQMGKPQEGFTSLMKAVHLGDSLYPKLSNTSGYFELEYALFKYYSATNKFTDAEKFLLKAYAKSVEEKVTDLQIKYLRDVVSFYLDHSQPEKARGYSSAYFKLSDTLNTNQNRFNIAQYEIEQKESEQNKKLSVLQQERAVQEATIKQRNLILWISLGAILLIAASVIFLYRQLVINKKVLQSLGKTQRQLILSEKMASLGELTAGIAHEIQNPLNFVNNFSEVSIELIEEVKSEKLKAESERDSELESELLDDISQNLQKIAHHGKRADGIVKGMLQHSRASSTSNQEPTDINKLADEYLRLAYHGLRAKDKTFNAAMDTDFDETIGNINIIPQDIGRVILNLITNAFYAVDEKKKHIVTDYEPTVSMSTKKVGDKVLIFVKDNGNGIPEKILDKIFQPFFTTKPTGQGTGLGLSMSYDVIKAHGGELRVETKEGEGSSFIVQLPIV